MASKGVKKQPGFEEELNRLEEMANRMEQPDLPLEELMRLYEEGLSLSRELAKKLETMKASMHEVRVGKDGDPVLKNSDLEAQTSIGDMLNAEDSYDGLL